MNVNITPTIFEDIGNFLEYVDNIRISNEIIGYKPLRRPITKKPSTGEYDSPNKIRTRKLIVRDWFFYAVWAARLKKVFKKAPDIIASQEKKLLEFRNSAEILARLTNNNTRKINKKNQDNIGERLETEHSGDSSDEEKHKQKQIYLNHMRQKINEELTRTAEENRKKEAKYWGIACTVRCQDFNMKIFNQNNHDIPTLEILFSVFFRRIY